MSYRPLRVKYALGLCAAAPHGVAPVGQCIPVKSPAEIELMARAGALLGECIAGVVGEVAPGVTTAELNRIAEEFIVNHGCIPGFKGYAGFPAATCISVNEEVVHGLPGRRSIESGDLISIDIGLSLGGWWADSSCSVVCDRPDADDALVSVTEAALWCGIAEARPGRHIGDIGHAIQQIVEGEGYAVVPEYGGHNIGRTLHEAPFVPSHGVAGTGPELGVGNVLAIEPIVVAGGSDLTVRADGWTKVTVDGGRGCCFEHTVAVTADGPRVLTLRPGEVLRIG